MYDVEGNEIKLCSEPNANLLIWGRSGQGKTYLCCRKIEELVRQGRRVLILDYSGSYTKSELLRNRYCFFDKTQFINPYEYMFVWSPPYEDDEAMIVNLSDTLIEVTNIRSFFQRRWICKAVRECMRKRGGFSLPGLMEMLQLLYKAEKEKNMDRDNLKHISHLMDRISLFATINNFSVKRRTEPQTNFWPVSIVELSDFSEREKHFLTEFMVVSFWKEAVCGIKRSEVIVLDEFQFLPMKKGNALLSILREGRKYRIEPILCTQFICHYDKEAKASLLQAGNILIFRPSAEDLKFSANIIDAQNSGQWRQLLEKLKVGEAVLKGTYTLNNGAKKITKPIICRI